MSGFKVPIQEIIEGNREEEWERAGVPEADIEFSRKTGMDGRDVQALRKFSTPGILVVVRCPKVTARAHHGVFPPKPMAVKDKPEAKGKRGRTGSSGLVVTEDHSIYVSDYDLMCIWRLEPGGPVKVFTSAAAGKATGPWPAEALAIVKAINARLESKLQHGCQDDFDNADNRGLKRDDQFAAFYTGVSEFLPSQTEYRHFYEKQHRLHPWPYNDDGSYRLGTTKAWTGSSGA